MLRTVAYLAGAPQPSIGDTLMEQSGEHRILSGREDVWASLNDPEVLARCIDGCQSMRRLEDGSFAAAVKAKVGPIRTTFQAKLRLADLQPPASYSIHADVNGGAVGFAKGSAKVLLEADGPATLLRYEISAKVGGKLAQLGTRLVDGVARKMAADFFAAFSLEFAPPAGADGGLHR